jgi:hypothetical protein
MHAISLFVPLFPPFFWPKWHAEYIKKGTNTKREKNPKINKKIIIVIIFFKKTKLLVSTALYWYTDVYSQVSKLTSIIRSIEEPWNRCHCINIKHCACFTYVNTQHCDDDHKSCLKGKHHIIWVCGYCHQTTRKISWCLIYLGRKVEGKKHQTYPWNKHQSRCGLFYYHQIICRIW